MTYITNSNLKADSKRDWKPLHRVREIFGVSVLGWKILTVKDLSEGRTSVFLANFKRPLLHNVYSDFESRNGFWEGLKAVITHQWDICRLCLSSGDIEVQSPLWGEYFTLLLPTSRKIFSKRYMAIFNKKRDSERNWMLVVGINEILLFLSPNWKKIEDRKWKLC